MAYDVRVTQADAVLLAVVRRRGSPSELARLVPECCGLVWNFVRARNLRAGRNVALYWDDAITLEVGVEVTGAFAEEGEVVLSATPSGAVASVAHFGPYDRLGAAHDAVRKWCNLHHYRLVGPKWEVYGHWREEWDADPSRIRTDVCYQVEVPDVRVG